MLLWLENLDGAGGDGIVSQPDRFETTVRSVIRPVVWREIFLPVLTFLLLVPM